MQRALDVPRGVALSLTKVDDENVAPVRPRAAASLRGEQSVQRFGFEKTG